MEILIIGAGDVGSNIAYDLADDHDLTVIDRDSARIDTLTTESSVTGIVGDGRSAATLREADLDQTDLVIASTDSDATNIMVCNAAKRATDLRTIARVKSVGLFQTWQSLEGNLGVDTMLCVDWLAAEALVQTVALPGAQAVDTFADGLAEVAEFEIAEGAPVANQSIADADRYPSLTFAAIFRDDDVLIPSGDTVIQPGDCVVVIGAPHGASRFADDNSPQTAPDPQDDIVIFGGATLGYNVARSFEDRGWEPLVVERDPERVTWLANRLRGSRVIEADVTDVDEPITEHLTDADLLVGAVDDDTNYLLAELASELSGATTATVVDDPAVIDLFEDIGIDVVVHPKDIVAGEILRAVYRRGPEDVTVLEHDNAEVFEVVVDEESVLTGKPLYEVTRQIPTGITIGAIIRGGTLKTPRGNTIIEKGDRVIAIVDAEGADEVAEMI
jgi:trk system potassium uptake protein TrkA